MRDAPPDEQAILGTLPGVDSDWLVARFDPSGAESTIESEVSWIRDTPDGIEIARHPEAALRDDSMLWEPMSQWHSGLWRAPMTLADYERLSNFELEIIETAQPAHDRERRRREPKPKPSAGGEA